jgi:hypothetical protein
MGDTDNQGVIRALMLAGGLMLVMVFSILGTVVWNIRKMERRNRLKFKEFAGDAAPQPERWPFL